MLNSKMKADKRILEAFLRGDLKQSTVKEVIGLVLTYTQAELLREYLEGRAKHE